MANVLPPSAQKDLLRNIRARFLLVGALIMLATAAIAFLSLVPAYVVLQAEQTPGAADSSGAGGASAQDKNDSSDIVRTQQLLNQMALLRRATTTPTQALLAALAGKQSDIRIFNISYLAGEKGQIILSGATASRDSLNAYRDALSRDERFTDVSVPVSALVGASDGRFSVTLLGAF